jgi:purine nucleosidase
MCFRREAMTENKVTKLIIDTDIEASYDDVGALAVAHSLASRGEAEILAVICDTVESNGAPCIDVINNYYKQPDIPIGAVRIKDYKSNKRYDRYREYINKIPRQRLYNEDLKCNTQFKNFTNEDYRDAVEVYRRVLSKQEDSSVTICALGYLTAIEQLFKSTEDKYSDLKGCELFKRKVNKIVVMSDISFPGEVQGSFNWDMELESAIHVINNSPCPIVISGHGKGITAGKRLIREISDRSPIRRVYEKYLASGDEIKGCWDQIAILYSVIGESSIFKEEKGYTLCFDHSTGKFLWRVGEDRQDAFVRLLITEDELSDMIDELMCYETNTKI